MKNKAFSITIPAVLLVGAFLFYVFSSPVKAKCPDDYGTDEAGSAEYLAATNKWTNDFFDAHPDASLKEWGEARHQFWIDNNCEIALRSYEEVKAGKADPETMEKVDGIIRDAINNPTPTQ